ncbi:MAG: hypothetical protein QM803_04880 [Rhodocyclaceae bacterium]
MSSKTSIKWRDRALDQPGFDLYEDVLDGLIVKDGVISEDDSREPPVYLRLEGVQVQLETLDGPGVSLTVKMPRETARALGLLPLGGEPSAPTQ